ncbi:MAG TPA: ABC transporter ATP-binding protein [Gemmatimonadaceae bacterium]|nr:ABC transporter ATP-binding protein [Gemmatimonadaceae bacterium]
MTSFVLRILRPYWKWLSVVLLAMLVETAMSLAQPWPLKVALDSVFGTHPMPAFLDGIEHHVFGLGTRGNLAVAAAAVLVIALIGSIATYVDDYLSTLIGQEVARDLRRDVYSHLQRLSLSYYDTHQTGNLLSTITDDVGAVQSFASNAVLGILIDILTMIGMLGVMFYVNWDFTLIALAMTPLLALFTYRLTHVVKKAQKTVRAKQSEMLSVIQEELGAIRVVKAFARGEFEEQRLDRKIVETIDATLRARRLKALMSPVVMIVVAIGTSLVLLYGGHLVLAGTMTVGSLVVFLAYLSKLFKPIQDLAKMTNAAAAAAVGLDRIKQILDTDSRLAEAPDAKVADRVKGDVEFEAVAFEYDKGHPVLNDVSFKVPAGQVVGIVGETGGGKSTIMNLIPRFYDPSGGVVRFDGVDLKNYTVKSIRNQIGFVMQDTVLFRGTVWENIAYGRPGASRDEIVRAATLANADGFIRQMPHGYDTIVGERGATMSGGQRQRIGIARALIRDAPLLLLDEPTSGLDAESERLVFEGLQTLMKGRTVFVIAHRLATIREANLILVVKGGRIIERGTHDELMALGGFYAQLHRTQFDESAAASADATLAGSSTPS